MASRGQPLRPRHVPQRTCVGCRSQQSKRDLLRIVRTPSGEVVVDPTGRLPGRGAYLHQDTGCWSEGLRKGRLGRALHAVISPEDERAIATVLGTFVGGRVEERQGRLGGARQSPARELEASSGTQTTL